MGSGDLSTDLALGILTPAPTVRTLGGQTSDRDLQGNARRRPRPKDENLRDDSRSEASEASDRPKHQVDDLA
jgi:hypothetical protein